MADRGVALDSKSARRVAETVRAAANDPIRRENPGWRLATGHGDTATVRITNTRKRGNFYPGKVVIYQWWDNTWIDLDDCWVFAPNFECLTTKRYVARRIAQGSPDGTTTTTTTGAPGATTTSTTTTTVAPPCPATTTTTTGTTTTTTTTTGTGTSTSTTTTTTSPVRLIFLVTGEVPFTSCGAGTTTTGQPCAGFCRWAWNTSSKKWDLDCASCSGKGCQCDPPQFCGGACGGAGTNEVTLTYCTHNPQPGQPLCATTTTATTTTGTGTTTTTTAGPTTTTTHSPECRSCLWVFVDGSGWVLVENGCTGDCTCPGPPSSASLCSTAETSCISPPPPPPPPPLSCKGKCKWVYINGEWFPVESTCQGVGTACVCEPPSIAASAPVGAEGCSVAETSCAIPVVATTTGTGTTTTAAGTTTTAGPPIITTTTSGPGCTGVCRWRWDTTAQAWSMQCTNCPSYCCCSDPPPYSGTSANQVAETSCRICPTTTTTTVTTTTGTTTSTTTTTTAAPCSGTCRWQCSSSRVWTFVASNCVGAGCGCFVPGARCSFPGQIADTPCALTNVTTTTACPTTTTPAPVANCGNWCYWTFNGSSWNLAVNNCGFCSCSEPPPPASSACDGWSAYTSCQACPTTTTSAQVCGFCQWTWAPGYGWQSAIVACTGGCGCSAPVDEPGPNEVCDWFRTEACA